MNHFLSYLLIFSPSPFLLFSPSPFLLFSLDWVMEDQWIVSPPDKLSNVLEAISIGLYGPKQKQEVSVDPKKGKKEKDKKDKKEKKEKDDTTTVPATPSKKITQAARFLLDSLLNKLGVFPSPSCGPSSVSSLITEEELVNDIVAKAEALGVAIPDKKQFVRAFILQGSTIVTLVDHPFEEGGPMCTVILRDGTGRYCWQCTSAYLSFAERGIPSKTIEHCSQSVDITTYVFSFVLFSFLFIYFFFCYYFILFYFILFYFILF
jgi:hypothetical protein